ncbi:MAG: MBL fold metallo-hydrolase, partial [Patescibacteria group bacterium]
IFAGDSPKAIEQYLVSVYGDPPAGGPPAGGLNCEVLKVGHHGSDTSTSESFLGYVDPEYAVISVGENKYGHPHQEVLDLLGRFGINILRTDESGTIKIKSDGENLVIF